ncbi:hypothetical protein INP83_18585 [Mucilaginibacter sp. 21P]|uniref:toxin-antitoxin system YwqK family antitoxin n=1 Tax=Mucilaginibacter sp. 21P TaxID=2778902 RepID=UPI001C59D8CE|nr:hypothetical protein [Mucilaginibacter sp. 21P]QXV65064.1 hypothetical protein INP83_18585 [Mucilaginibacter sp. 21P]
MELRVNYNELEIFGFDSGGSEILHYNGKPFNGFSVDIANGIIREEREFRDGYLHGLQRYYYPSGNLQEEYTLIDNDLDGSFKQYDENGNLTSVTNWKNGMKV